MPTSRQLLSPPSRRSGRQEVALAPCSAAFTDRLNGLVLEFFIDNCLAFNVADSESFIELLKHAASGSGHFKPHGRTALTANVDQLYRHMMDTLLADLRANAVAITTDAATLRNGHSFLAVTGHYITPLFELRDVTLAVQRMEGSHTGEYVRDLLDYTVSAWEAEGRVFAAVTDNGSNFVRAATISTQISNTYRCACHTLQLALKDSVKQQPSLDRMTVEAQKLVKVIRRSNLLVEKLDDLQKMESAAELFINADSDNVAAQAPDQSLRLILHVVTRFNSMCMLFTRLYDLKAHVQRLCREERDKLDGACITPEQWTEMGELISVLEPVKEVCDRLEASTCPSISLVIPLIAELIDHLTHRVHPSLRTASCQAVCNAVRTAVFERMKSAFDDHAAQVAMMLDPRVRTKKLPEWLGDKRAAIASLHVQYATYGTSRISHLGAANVPPPPAAPASSVVISEQRPAKRQKRVVLQEESAALDAEPVSEIDLYLRERGIGVDDDGNEQCPLVWWKEREARYPILSQMARVFLCIPASSAPAERVFSAGTLVVRDNRRRLDDDRIAKLMFVKKNVALYRKLKGL